MAWQIDWKRKNQAAAYWGRNTDSIRPATRQWHWVTAGYLRHIGIATPQYGCSWEFDWSKRRKKCVWARNTASKMPSARVWHWVTFETVQRAGLKWKPIRGDDSGRWINDDGYVMLSRKRLTPDELLLVNEHDLWTTKNNCLEHRLVALKKFGNLLRSEVVRHRNGIKHDNRDDNLLKGTTQENTADHNTARLMAMFWHGNYLSLCEQHGHPPEAWT